MQVVFVFVGIGVWMGLHYWTAMLLSDGNTAQGGLTLLGAIVVSSILIYLTRSKIPNDRSPMVERTIDFFSALIANVVIAFIFYQVVGRI